MPGRPAGNAARRQRQRTKGDRTIRAGGQGPEDLIFITHLLFEMYADSAVTSRIRECGTRPPASTTVRTGQYLSAPDDKNCPPVMDLCGFVRALSHGRIATGAVGCHRLGGARAIGAPAHVAPAPGRRARISISTLEKALNGNRGFTLATIVRLEQALGVPRCARSAMPPIPARTGARRAGRLFPRRGEDAGRRLSHLAARRSK